MHAHACVLACWLQALEEDPTRKPRVVKREVLCRSLAGNAVDMLTVTTPSEDAEAMKRRKAVVISGGAGLWRHAVNEPAQPRFAHVGQLHACGMGRG